MDFTKSKSSRKCLNDSCCDKQHFIRYMKDSASNWFVVNTSDFIDMWRHHKKYVEKTCDYVCPNEKMCELHQELQNMTDYVEWVRDKNLNYEYETIKTIGVVFSSNDLKKKTFWQINIIEWETISPPENATIKRKSNFL